MPVRWSHQKHLPWNQNQHRRLGDVFSLCYSVTCSQAVYTIKSYGNILYIQTVEIKQVNTCLHSDEALEICYRIFNGFLTRHWPWNLGLGLLHMQTRGPPRSPDFHPSDRWSASQTGCSGISRPPQVSHRLVSDTPKKNGFTKRHSQKDSLSSCKDF